jgi:hypothetical protein
MTEPLASDVKLRQAGMESNGGVRILTSRAKEKPPDTEKKGLEATAAWQSNCAKSVTAVETNPFGETPNRVQEIQSQEK